MNKFFLWAKFTSLRKNICRMLNSYVHFNPTYNKDTYIVFFLLFIINSWNRTIVKNLITPTCMSGLEIFISSPPSFHPTIFKFITHLYLYILLSLI